MQGWFEHVLTLLSPNEVYEDQVKVKRAFDEYSEKEN